MSNPFVLRAALLLLGSGFCALVYQTAWLRMLRVVFGGTTAANAAVLAVFMGGLGFGAWLLGERVERRDNPLRFYALLEAGVTVAAAVSPLLVVLVRTSYIAVGGSATLGDIAGTGLLLLLTAIVLGIPAFLMGGTLPAMVRAVETSADPNRRFAGLLYGVNTIGAVSAVLWTTFYSIDVLGTRLTLWLGCGLNLAIAGAAAWMAKRAPAAQAAPDEAPPAPRGSPERSPSSNDQPVSRPLVLAAAAVVGFAFFLMELVWYRMLAPILGGSAYTFGIILAVALLGVGAGGVIYARAARMARPTLRVFALTCSLEALFMGIPYALGDRITYLAALVFPVGGVSFAALAGGWMLITAIVVFPAAIVAGYQFPVLLSLAGVGERGVGRDLGQVYAWNTVGAIVGCLAGGFGLHPWLSAPAVWQLTVLLLAILAVVCLVWTARARAAARQLLPIFAIAVAAALTPLALGPTAVWRHSGVGVGAEDLSASSWNAYRELQHANRRSVLWERDGVEASVALVRSNGLAFMINGKSDGNARWDAPTMILAGLIGAIRHPAPRRVLVIGLGTGETAGWLAALPEVERVDVVELEPVVVEVARACAPANLGALSNPKVHVILGDAREVIATASERYDLIVSEPSNPYRIGVASLFTRDFYEIVEARLADGGIFVQWVQAYAVDAATIRTMYATLSAVFPYIESWEGNIGADLLFVISRDPLPHDLELIGSRVTAFPYRQALQLISGVYGIEGLYASFIATPELARAIADAHTGPLHTDDRPVFEFAMARMASLMTSFQIRHVRAAAIRRGEAHPETTGGSIDWQRADEMRTLASIAHGKAPFLALPGDEATRRRVQTRGAYWRGDLDLAPLIWPQEEGSTVGPMDLTMLAELTATTGHPDAETWIAALAQQSPIESAIVAGIWHNAMDRPAEAANALAVGLRGYRKDPWPYIPLMRRGIELARELGASHPETSEVLIDALSQPFSVHMLDELRHVAAVDVATAVDSERYCVGAFTELEPWPVWTEEMLERRHQCYARGEHPLAARSLADLELYRRHKEIPFDAGIEVEAEAAPPAPRGNASALSRDPSGAR